MWYYPKLDIWQIWHIDRNSLYFCQRIPFLISKSLHSIVFFIVKTQRDVIYMSNVSNRILAAPSPSLHIVRLLRRKALYPCPPENRTHRLASAFFRLWSSSPDGLSNRGTVCSYQALWRSASVSAGAIPLGSSSLSAVHHIGGYGDGDRDGGLALILFDNPHLPYFSTAAKKWICGRNFPTLDDRICFDCRLCLFARDLQALSCACFTTAGPIFLRWCPITRA